MVQQYPLPAPPAGMIECEMKREAEGYNVDLTDFRAALDALLADKAKRGTKVYRLAMRVHASLPEITAAFATKRPGVKSQTEVYANLVNITGGASVLLEHGLALAAQVVLTKLGDPSQKPPTRQTLVVEVGGGLVDRHGGKADERGLGLDVQSRLEMLPSWPILFESRPASGLRSTVVLHPSPIMVEIMKYSKAGFVPRHRPMLVPPKPWTQDAKGGYLDPKLMRRRSLVKNRPAQYRKDLLTWEMPEVYNAVNAVQETAWKVNAPIFEVVSKRGESIIKSSARSRKAIRGRTTALRSALKVAADVLNEPAIYFPHDLDWRGRLYSMPAFLNPQGADEVKALLMFAESKPITTAEQLRWLMIHGANTFGQDKISFDARVTWVKKNEPMILATAASPLTETDWCKADDPFQFLAFCFEWKRLTDYRAEHGGSFRGFESGLPVGMDGSCNGLQHLSAILRDPEGGAAVNLLPADKPQDVYGKVAEVVKARVERDEPTSAIARAWLAFGIDRKLVKNATMNYSYGQSRGGRAEGLREVVGYDPVYKPVPKRPKGHNKKKWAAKVKASRPDWWAWHPHFKPLKSSPVSYLEPIVREAIENVVKAAPDVRKWLEGVALEAAAGNKPVSWITPARFPVLVWKVKKVSTAVTTKAFGRQTRLHFLEEVRPVQHLGNTLTLLNGKAKARLPGSVSAITACFVHSQDAAHLMLSANAARPAGVTSFHMVHDNYGTTAADAPMLVRVLRRAFVEMYEDHNVLAEMRESMSHQLRRELPQPPPGGDLNIRQVLDSTYFFA